jgi:ATP-dependent DNA helicase RecG
MRPSILNPLFAEASVLKGVGPAVARGLSRLGLNRAADLLFHLPVGVIERFRLSELSAAYVDRIVTVELRVVGHDSGGPRSPSRVRCIDEGGNAVTLVYFADRGGYAKKLLPIGERRLVSGKLERYGSALQIVHPDYVLPVGSGETIPEREPVYGLTEGIANKRMRALVGQALDRMPELAEWIEPSVLAARRWPGWRQALIQAHRLEALGPARDRLAYDELLANQLALMLVRADTRRRRGRPLPGTGKLTDALIAKLPYRPTGAQLRAVAEIAGDLAQTSPMLRLLQGDVGSGKTLVALLSMLTTVESGAQAAMLAPTEILSRQHFANLTALLDGLPVRVAILTGREKGRARAGTLKALAAGEIDILVGTHAIFQEAVAYRRLGFVVIDEQHRFGVHQRLMLANKAERPAHVLVMTATPIPRTLTLTVYGEMDVSRLDEMPAGRQPIDTRVVPLERLLEVYAALGRHIAGGGQAYWVCPLVEESEKGDLAAAEARAASLRDHYGAAVGVVHGRMKGPEKDAVMADFQAGLIQVLVATTVIEVGVDVPNATLMIIEQAERFGLAQLHQLRGRVGRGSGKSVCLLLRSPTISETARSRLSLMRETNDGFRIAEEDLRLRGGGEILGVRQSGEPEFRLADPMQMSELLPIARDDARLLVERDGGLDSPRGQAARLLLYLFERDAAVGLLRSG